MPSTASTSTARPVLVEGTYRGFGTGFFRVMVGGQQVGTVAKNKYGVWLGHFDSSAFKADGDTDYDREFTEAARECSVLCSVRHIKRGKRQVVADVVNRVVRPLPAA